jgi:serpin B
MNRRTLLLSLCSLTACASARPDAIDARPPVRDPASHGDSSDVPAMADPGGANAFAFDLYDQLATEPGNLAYSPTSISLAMAMTWGGARGETADQIRDVLHLGADAAALHAGNAARLSAWNDPARTAYELRVVNRLFGEASATWQPDFLQLTDAQYGARLEALDFIGAPEPSRARINAWVEEQTKDRIKDLLPLGSIDSDTRLVLTNAIYFKGKWKSEFDPDATVAGDFHRIGATPVKAKMMHQRADLSYAKVDGVHVLEMPYTGDDLAMSILLPAEKDGLAALEQKLDAGTVAGFIGALAPQQVDVTLPRFKLDPPEPTKLKKPLQALGMSLPFTRDADFGGMSEDIHPLYIDDVYHKAFVEVNEEGTEAAAATAVVVRTESAVMEPEVVAFVADHPFVFLIRDVKSGAILFVGRVADPTA